MSRSYLVLQDRIVGLLSAIKAVGKVMVNFPYTESEESFVESFMTQAGIDKKQINAWVVTFSGAQVDRSVAPTGTYFVRYAFAIKGYLSYNETSENEIQRMAMDILDTLAPLLTLDVQVKDAIIEDSSVSVESFGSVELGPVLCSTCNIGVTARERVQGITYR